MYIETYLFVALYRILPAKSKKNISFALLLSVEMKKNRPIEMITSKTIDFIECPHIILVVGCAPVCVSVCVCVGTCWRLFSLSAHCNALFPHSMNISTLNISIIIYLFILHFSSNKMIFFFFFSLFLFSTFAFGSLYSWCVSVCYTHQHVQCRDGKKEGEREKRSNYYKQNQMKLCFLDLKIFLCISCSSAYTHTNRFHFIRSKRRKNYYWFSSKQ